MNYAIQTYSSQITQAFGPLKTGQANKDQRAPAPLAAAETASRKPADNSVSHISSRDVSEQKTLRARQESPEGFLYRIDQLVDAITDAQRLTTGDFAVGEAAEVGATVHASVLDAPTVSSSEAQDHYGFLDDRLLSQTAKLAYKTYDQIDSVFFRERDLASLIVGVDTFV